MLTFRRISRNKGIFLLVTALYTLLAPNVFAGFSLCIGKDGHVAFESPSAECCARQGNESTALQDGDLAGECTVCLDIQLTGDIQTAVFQNSQSIAMGLLPIGFVTLSPDPVLEVSHAGTQPPVSPFLATLRTTRLLI